jgi:hypothetical protein
MERGRTGKRRGKKKIVSERFSTCKNLRGKLGLRLLAVSAFRGFWGVKPRRKKKHWFTVLDLYFAPLCTLAVVCGKAIVPSCHNWCDMSIIIMSSSTVQILPESNFYKEGMDACYVMLSARCVTVAAGV